MAIDFTGTATEKTDKLVAAVVDFKAVLRMLQWAAAICFPLIVTLHAFVINKAYETERRIDKLEMRMDGIEKRMAGIEDRMARIETLLGKIVENQERVMSPKK